MSHSRCPFLLLLMFIVFCSSVEAKSQFKDCPLPDGSRFHFEGRHLPFMSIFMTHSSTPPDPFAYAYSVTFIGKDGRPTTQLPFNDNAPACKNYGIAGDLIYAMTEDAIYRSGSQNRPVNKYVLMVSHDGGRSFGPNIHPSYVADQQNIRALKNLHIFKSKFGMIDKAYILEILSSHDYDDFLQIVSHDGGQTWAAPTHHPEPLLLNAEEVSRGRYMAEINHKVNWIFPATQEACRLQPEPGCALETERFYQNLWDECRKQHDVNECLRLLPKPKPVLKPQSISPADH